VGSRPVICGESATSVWTPSYGILATGSVYYCGTLELSEIKEAEVAAEKWHGQWEESTMVGVMKNGATKALGIKKYTNFSQHSEGLVS
jgi:hypothetical protein